MATQLTKPAKETLSKAGNIQLTDDYKNSFLDNLSDLEIEETIKGFKLAQAQISLAENPDLIQEFINTSSKSQDSRKLADNSPDANQVYLLQLLREEAEKGTLTDNLSKLIDNHREKVDRAEKLLREKQSAKFFEEFGGELNSLNQFSNHEVKVKFNEENKPVLGGSSEALTALRNIMISATVVTGVATVAGFAAPAFGALVFKGVLTKTAFAVLSKTGVLDLAQAKLTSAITSLSNSEQPSSEKNMSLSKKIKVGLSKGLVMGAKAGVLAVAATGVVIAAENLSLEDAYEALAPFNDAIKEAKNLMPESISEVFENAGEKLSGLGGSELPLEDIDATNSLDNQPQQSTIEPKAETTISAEGINETTDSAKEEAAADTAVEVAPLHDDALTKSLEEQIGNQQESIQKLASDIRIANQNGEVDIAKELTNELKAQQASLDTLNQKLESSIPQMEAQSLETLDSNLEKHFEDKAINDEILAGEEQLQDHFDSLQVEQVSVTIDKAGASLSSTIRDMFAENNITFDSVSERNAAIAKVINVHFSDMQNVHDIKLGQSYEFPNYTSAEMLMNDIGDYDLNAKNIITEHVNPHSQPDLTEKQSPPSLRSMSDIPSLDSDAPSAIANTYTNSQTHSELVDKYERMDAKFSSTYYHEGDDGTTSTLRTKFSGKTIEDFADDIINAHYQNEDIVAKNVDLSDYKAAIVNDLLAANPDISIDTYASEVKLPDGIGNELLHVRAESAFFDNSGFESAIEKNAVMNAEKGGILDPSTQIGHTQTEMLKHFENNVPAANASDIFYSNEQGVLSAGRSEPQTLASFAEAVVQGQINNGTIETTKDSLVDSYNKIYNSLLEANPQMSAKDAVSDQIKLPDELNTPEQVGVRPKGWLDPSLPEPPVEETSNSELSSKKVRVMKP